MAEFYFTFHENLFLKYLRITKIRKIAEVTTLSAENRVGKVTVLFCFSYFSEFNYKK